LGEGDFSPKRWSKYIGQFRGSSEEDCERIREVLQEEGIDICTEDRIDRNFAKRISDNLVQMKQADTLDTMGFQRLSDKCERDGRVVALLQHLRKRRQHANLSGTAVVISSSRSLQRACHGFRERFGDPEPVLQVGAIGFLLSLIPGVRMGLNSLAKILFDPGFADRLAPLERLALRVIHQSKQYSLPWARRGTMKREMRNKIGDMARQKGVSKGEIEREVMAEDESARETFTEIVAKSVDKLVESRAERGE